MGVLAQLENAEITENESTFPLGENFFPLLILAIGAALVVGTVLALVNPPKELKEDQVEKPPLPRVLVQITLGVAMLTWSLATLFSG